MVVQVVLEKMLLYGKHFHVPVESSEDTLSVLLSDGATAEVSQ